MNRLVHGHSSRVGVSPTYISWIGMRSRCDYPTHRKYHLYGGVGITYDPRWKDFKTFLADMGERPEGKTLDRKENHLGYHKENCVWATPTEQNIHQPLRKDNTSGVKGVSWNKKIHRWIARGHLHGKEYLLYCGDSFEGACTARQWWEDDAREDLLASGDPR